MWMDILQFISLCSFVGGKRMTQNHVGMDGMVQESNDGNQELNSSSDVEVNSLGVTGMQLESRNQRVTYLDGTGPPNDAIKSTPTLEEMERILGCDNITTPKNGPDCGSDNNSACYNQQVKAYMKILAMKNACHQLMRAKQPCGKALEGKWRGTHWWGPFQAFGEIVWTDVSKAKASFGQAGEWMDSQTKSEGWGPSLTRSFGEMAHEYWSKVADWEVDLGLQKVGIVNEIIHEEVGDSPDNWALSLAKLKFEEMTTAATFQKDGDELEDEDFEEQADAEPDHPEPICIVKRHDLPKVKRLVNQHESGNHGTVWGLLYKTGRLSGGTAYESSSNDDLKNKGAITVKEHKGTAGDASQGRGLKIQWFVTEPEEGNEDLVTAEWTKVLQPLDVMPISEEGRRVRILHLIMGRFLGHMDIIKSGIKSKSKWLSWIRKWTSYCTITCPFRWVKVFYYTFKIKYETQKLMWLSQRQMGWAPGEFNDENFQEKALNALDTRTPYGLEKVGTKLKRGLWEFMTFMIKTTDNSFLLRTQFLFQHAIKQLVLGPVLRILGLDDMAQGCVWKGILEKMENSTEKYKRKNHYFWNIVTAWCPGWMAQLDQKRFLDRVTFKALQWVQNNTKSLTARVQKSWFLQKTKDLLVAMIEKIQMAMAAGTGPILAGITMMVDDIALNRLMKSGVIDEEEKRMMQSNNAPPPYPPRKGATKEKALGCLSYFNTNWIHATTEWSSWYNPFKKKVVEDTFEYSSEAHEGEMRVRNGMLEEGVVELRRHKDCMADHHLTARQNIERLWHNLVGPDKEIRVLALDAISDIIHIGNDTRLHGDKLKKGALEALEECAGTSADELEEESKNAADQVNIAINPAAVNDLEPRSAIEESSAKAVTQRHDVAPRKIQENEEEGFEGIDPQSAAQTHDSDSVSNVGNHSNSVGNQTDSARDFLDTNSNKQMCKALASKWKHLPEAGIFSHEGFQYCMLLLSFTDSGASQHILCSRTQDELQGWKSAIEFHTHMYRGESREQNNEFAAALEEEMDAASATVEEVMTRHNLMEKEGKTDDSVVQGEDQDAEVIGGDLLKTIREKTVETALLQYSEGGSNSSNQSQTALAAALAASHVAVDAAVAKYRVGLDLVKNDASNLEDAIGIFKTAFLQAHGHVRFLDAHGAKVTNYMCKSHDRYRQGVANNQFQPGDCVRTEDYRVAEYGGKWVSCKNHFDCNVELQTEGWGLECQFGNNACATSVNTDSIEMMKQDWHIQRNIAEVEREWARDGIDREAQYGHDGPVEQYHGYHGEQERPDYGAHGSRRRVGSSDMSRRRYSRPADYSRRRQPAAVDYRRRYSPPAEGFRRRYTNPDYGTDYARRRQPVVQDYRRRYAPRPSYRRRYGASNTGPSNPNLQYAAQGCFPSSALVEIRPSSFNGNIFPAILQQITDVRVGDFVRTADGFERIFAVTQWHPEAERIGFLRLEVSTGHEGVTSFLELTHRHLLPVDGKLIAADAVQAGDRLHFADGEFGTVVAIREVFSQGYHNLKTPSGLIAVRAPGSMKAIVASTAVDHGLPNWIQANTWLEVPLLVVSYVFPSLLDVGGSLDKVSTYLEHLSLVIFNGLQKYDAPSL